MRRREVLGVIGGALAWPLAARGSKPGCHHRRPRLGHSEPGATHKGAARGPARAGYVEGRNLRLEIRAAAGRPDLQLEKATELVGLKVDLIVTFFTPAALAAKQATRDIPIVMAGAGDPVESGLVAASSSPAATSPDSRAGARRWPARAWS